MKDIKELALRVAMESGFMLSSAHGQGERQLMPVSDSKTLIDFATRLIAAYLKEQEPVVRVVDGGGELHLPKLQWVSANVSLETPIGSDLFLAPPIPTDDSALMERLKQERERCAEFCEAYDKYDYAVTGRKTLADAIRGLA